MHIVKKKFLSEAIKESNAPGGTFINFECLFWIAELENVILTEILTQNSTITDAFKDQTETFDKPW